MKEMVVEKTLDSQLWHACAGGMVQMPALNSKVFYFPQGHAEHALSYVDFTGIPRIPALILCRVAAVRFLADPETDEVFARIRLIPIGNGDGFEFEEDSSMGSNGSESSAEKPASFAKTLTQSDANNGGGFSVPRYCAETIFPRLDYTADPPVQTVVAKDVHGETWKFRHIYRGTPRRHLLTTGWSNFVNQKKLVAGDSIVFLRADNGDLCVGIRRAKRGGIGGPDSPTGWHSSAGNYGGMGMGVGVGVGGGGGLSAFLREEENKLMRSGSNGNLNSCGGGSLKGRGRVRPELVIEAASLAARGQAFEVVYYPRASTPEFFVKASSVSSAMRVQWCPGMRFKMPFETEDSSRISWFMGTISSVQVADHIRWPNSPWRLLQVTWDEPDLLQNVKRVNPWLVELVSNMPVIHLSPFSPPRKKLRLPQHSDFPLDGQFPMSSFSGNPFGPSSTLCCPSDNISAGIQGARHAQLGVPISDLHLSNNKMHLGLLRPSFHQLFDPLAKIPNGLIRGSHLESSSSSIEDVSCLLTMGNSHQKLVEKNETTTTAAAAKTPHFLLFGQPILTEQQMSNDAVSRVEKSSSCMLSVKAERFSLDHQKLHPENLQKTGFLWNQTSSNPVELDTGHCKVFLESEDVGRTLDLSILGSYDELYKKLSNMFGIERSELESHVFYRDFTGTLKQAGDQPFSEFTKTAKRLTIHKNSGNSNLGRKWFTGLPTTERGLDSSNQTGPLSIFA